jgi:hypothetical protein
LLATTGACMLDRMGAIRIAIAGVPIPDSALVREATDLGQDVSQTRFDAVPATQDPSGDHAS